MFPSFSSFFFYSKELEDSSKMGELDRERWMLETRNEYFTLQLESFNFPRPLDLYRSMVKKVTF